MHGYVQEVLHLRAQLAPFISDIRYPKPRWISTPHGDAGYLWCSDCGYYVVRNLRRRDRKNRDDYLLDGGWSTEQESFCFCHGCGTRLDIGLTAYGVREEVAHYEECGYSTSPAEDAYELNEILSAIAYRSDREGESEAELRNAAITLAQGLLDQLKPQAQIH